jgi:hypothetical protein
MQFGVGMCGAGGHGPTLMDLGARVARGTSWVARGYGTLGASAPGRRQLLDGALGRWGLARVLAGDQDQALELSY